MTPQRITPLLLLVAALGLGAGACTFAATPNLSVAGPGVRTTQVVVTEAPPRVYYNGQWLYYRSDAYYYRSGTTWIVAPAVPTHVVTYHRPAPVHVVGSSRPVHVVSRPTAVRRTAPVVRSSGPVHVQRTVTNRRTTTTYRR